MKLFLDHLCAIFLALILVFMARDTWEHQKLLKAVQQNCAVPR